MTDLQFSDSARSKLDSTWGAERRKKREEGRRKEGKKEEEEYSTALSTAFQLLFKSIGHGFSTAPSPAVADCPPRRTVPRRRRASALAPEHRRIGWVGWGGPGGPGRTDRWDKKLFVNITGSVYKTGSYELVLAFSMP